MKKNTKSYSMYSSSVLITLILLGVTLIGMSSLLAQGSWTTKADLPTARAALSASVVNDTIYVMGGTVNGTPWGGPASPKMEIYDPTTDTWDTTKAKMPSGRNSLASVTVNGKIYALGGQSLGGITAESSVMIYDPQNDVWDTTTTEMPEPRSGLSASVVNDKIYVIGGWNFSTPKYRASVFEYDPATNSWDTTKADMPTPRAYLATCVVDNKIYAFGGINNDVTYDGLNTLEVYDPASNSWDTTKADMPAAHIYEEAEAVDGLIYIFGGSDNPDHLPASNVWEYSPAFDAYREVASMPMGLMHAASGEVDGKIYNFGGLETAIVFPFIASSKVFEFTPPITRNVPAGYPTIQAAIDSSSDGDLVLVADGTYYENINFKGKKITVASNYIVDGDTNHINNTIINGSQSSNPDSGSVVYFASNEDTNSVLKGFTITGGSGTVGILLPGETPGKSGGGIRVLFSGAKIEKNRIINNIIVTSDTIASGAGIVAFADSADHVIIRDNQISNNTVTAINIAFGGAISWGAVGTCIVERNRITDNSCNAANTYGGGLSVFGRMGSQWNYYVRNNIIRDNTLNISSNGGGGGVYIESCSPELTNNVISGNSGRYGGGIWISHRIDVGVAPKPVFISNTITNNSARDYGGGFELSGSPQAMLTVMNTILWGNSAGIGSPQIDIYSGASMTMQYSDVQDTLWPGTGNIDADPLLVADSLANASPCIGAGSLPCPPYDINGRMRPYPAGSNPDMGAWESKLGTPVGIEPRPAAGIVKSFTLEQNYPNPFNPTTNIEFSIPKSEFVTLKIYNLLGQEVVTLVSEKLAAGKYKYDWDAGRLASGVYLYRIQAGDYVETRKMVLIK